MAIVYSSPAYIKMLSKRYIELWKKVGSIKADIWASKYVPTHLWTEVSASVKRKFLYLGIIKDKKEGGPNDRA